MKCKWKRELVNIQADLNSSYMNKICDKMLAMEHDNLHWNKIKRKKIYPYLRMVFGNNHHWQILGNGTNKLNYIGMSDLFQ